MTSIYRTKQTMIIRKLQILQLIIDSIVNSKKNIKIMKSASWTARDDIVVGVDNEARI